MIVRKSENTPEKIIIKRGSMNNLNGIIKPATRLDYWERWEQYMAGKFKKHTAKAVPINQPYQGQEFALNDECPLGEKWVFECNHSLGLHSQDDSFSHEFGTQHITSTHCEYGCDDVTDEQAESYQEGIYSELQYRALQ